MKPGQDAIYTISGSELGALRRSPQLEGFRAKGVEVLLLTDPIDEFWVPSVRAYKDKPFRSAASAGTDLGKIEGGETAAEGGAEAAPTAGIEALVAAMKEALGEAVKDVRASKRLTESAVCLVAGEGDLDMHIERLLRQHRQLGAAVPRILEINPKHPLILSLASLAAAGHGDGGNDGLSEAAFLLLDQARILEGEPVADASAFARRMTAMMERGLAGGASAPAVEPAPEPAAS
jgi:molecular chaperone HtpG